MKENIREIAGVSRIDGVHRWAVSARERDALVQLEVLYDGRMLVEAPLTTDDCRHLALMLNRIARRVERRNP